MAIAKAKRGIPFIVLGCCVLPLALTSQNGTVKMILLGASILLNIIGLVVSIKNNNQTTKTK